MAALTPVVCGGRIGASLADADMAAAGGSGDTFPAGPDMYLRVKNGNAAACTVTVKGVSGGGPLGTTLADLALSPAVPLTTGDRLFGPFPAYPFAGADGTVSVTYSVTATVKVQAIKIAG